MRLNNRICEMGTVRYLQGKIVVGIQRAQETKCCAQGLTHRGQGGRCNFASDEDGSQSSGTIWGAPWQPCTPLRALASTR